MPARLQAMLTAYAGIRDNKVMQQRAVSVYRWVERMNRYDQDVPEFFDADADFVENDEDARVLDSCLAGRRGLCA